MEAYPMQPRGRYMKRIGSLADENFSAVVDIRDVLILIITLSLWNGNLILFSVIRQVLIGIMVGLEHSASGESGDRGGPAVEEVIIGRNEGLKSLCRNILLLCVNVEHRVRVSSKNNEEKKNNQEGGHGRRRR
nr:hypothetical protein Itr_chr14CG21520 [Ipomoea trifida]